MYTPPHFFWGYAHIVNMYCHLIIVRFCLLIIHWITYKAIVNPLAIHGTRVCDAHCLFITMHAHVYITYQTELYYVCNLNKNVSRLVYIVHVRVWIRIHAYGYAYAFYLPKLNIILPRLKSLEKRDSWAGLSHKVSFLKGKCVELLLYTLTIQVYLNFPHKHYMQHSSFLLIWLELYVIYNAGMMVGMLLFASPFRYDCAL